MDNREKNRKLADIFRQALKETGDEFDKAMDRLAVEDDREITSKDLGEIIYYLLLEERERDPEAFEATRQALKATREAFKNVTKTVVEAYRQREEIKEKLQNDMRFKELSEKADPNNKLQQLLIQTVSTERIFKEEHEEESDLPLLVENENDIEEFFAKGLVSFYNSDFSIILDNPLAKAMTRPEADKSKEKFVVLSRKNNNIIAGILKEGYITPFELELMQALTKYKMSGQKFPNGHFYCTVGQIYREIRGRENISPTEEQKQEIINALEAMEEPKRKARFEAENKEFLEQLGIDSLKSVRWRIVSFDEYDYQIRGQEEVVLVFDETPVLMQLSEEFGLYEKIDSDLKQIEWKIWSLELDTGETIKGTEAKCKSELKKRNLTRKNIIKASHKLEYMPQSKSRIAIRSKIFQTVWSYMRTRGAEEPGKHSNQINYEMLFAQCEIGTHSEQRRRAKETMFAVMDHLKRKGVITHWEQYKNTRSKKYDGIRFFIGKLIEE